MCPDALCVTHVTLGQSLRGKACVHVSRCHLGAKRDMSPWGKACVLRRRLAHWDTQLDRGP